MIGVEDAQDAERSTFLMSLVRINTMFPLLRYLTMPGTYVWLVIVLCALLIRSRRWSAFIWFIPAILTILICFASPLSNALRYELPIVLCAPLMLAWVFVRGENPVCGQRG